MFFIKKVLVLILAAIIICSCIGAAYAANLKVGSRGDKVKEVQQALINAGYYPGAVDGIYGTQTKTAVMKFQKDCGLVVDGIVGPATLKYLGLSDGQSNYVNEDLKLLARIISAEARGEPYEGQVAVGAVIMNRLEHPSFPNTLSGVIYQNGAFTAIVDGQFNEPVADSAYKAAKEAMAGVDPTGGAIYYYNPTTAKSEWIRTRPIIYTIGEHVFCS